MAWAEANCQATTSRPTPCPIFKPPLRRHTVTKKGPCKWHVVVVGCPGEGREEAVAVILATLNERISGVMYPIVDDDDEEVQCRP